MTPFMKKVVAAGLSTTLICSTSFSTVTNFQKNVKADAQEEITTTETQPVETAVTEEVTASEVVPTETTEPGAVSEEVTEVEAVPAETTETEKAVEETTEEVTRNTQRIIKGPETYTYTGEVIKPELKVVLGAVTLTEGTDYEIVPESYVSNIHVGEVSAQVVGLGRYAGILDDTFYYAITPKNLGDEDIVLDLNGLKSSYEFIGKYRTPILKVSYQNQSLSVMKDYMVTYEDNFYPGTAKIVLEGMEDYTGQLTKTFNIVKKPIVNVTIRTSFDSNKNLVVTINNGSYKMTKGTDYNYTAVADAAGNITLTFTGLGSNYTGTYVKKIPATDNPGAQNVTTTAPDLNVDDTQISKAENVKKKKVKLSWKKLTDITGYQLRYSTDKHFKKAIAKNIKKTKKNYTIGSLILKQNYYFSIRGYRKYKDKTYYGKWSKKQKVKISK